MCQASDFTDEIVDELQFISAPVLKDLIESTLSKCNCDLGTAIIADFNYITPYKFSFGKR